MQRFPLYISIITIAILLTLQGCGIYSFTGASIPPEAKTIAVQFFPNRALLIQPTLSQTFTDALKDKFVGQSGLTLISNTD